MSVRVRLDSLTHEQLDKCREELTFQYKEKNIMKYKSKYKPKPKIVTSYREGEKYINIPMYWAWTNLKLHNTYGLEPAGFKQVGSPWNNKQKEELEQVVKKLRKKRTVALTLRTGAGKTAVALFSCCHINLLTVVFVHNSDHCDQWAASVEKYTTAKYEIIKTNTNGVRKDTQIIICLYTRWEKIPKCVRQRVGLLIVDECDEYNNTSGVNAIASVNPMYTLGCTATFARPGTGLETIMHSFLGYSFVTRSFDVDFKVVKVLTGIEGTLVPSKHTKGNDWHTLKKSLLYDMHRNSMIVQLVLIQLEENRKIMIVCTEVDHAKILYKLLSKRNVDCDYLYGSKKKSYKDSSVLIGTAKRCGRGFDEESFCSDWNGVRIDCVMLVDFVKNDVDRTQWIGRAFRAKDPVVFQLVDNNNTMANQWKAAERMYLWMGASIEECELEMGSESDDICSITE